MIRAAQHAVQRASTLRNHIRQMASTPIAVVVKVEIVPERKADFLEAMRIDAEGSRAEDGCLRFDLLQDQSDENTFFFYEAYKDTDAIAVHKETAHYKAWSDFKASGGVVSQTANKTNAINWTE